MREIREHEGLPRRRVAVALDVTERSIQNWEDPQGTALPDAHEFLQLLTLYNADLEDLKDLGRSGLPPGAKLITRGEPPVKSADQKKRRTGSR